MGRRSSSGGVNPKGDRIEVRFTFNGKELRPTLPLKPTTANLKHALRMRASILDEIKAGTFKLADHFPEYKFADKHEASDEASARTFEDWGDLWAKLAARELEHSTLSVYKNHLAAYWTSVWGGLLPKKITHEMVLTRLADLSAEHIVGGKVRKGLSRKTQNNILIPLRGVFGIICKALSILDPTDGIKDLKVQGGEPDPFTLAEVEMILTDLRKPRGKMSAAQTEALADYYEFSAFAGPRPSEHIALRWADISFADRTMKVSRAFVLGKAKERTKTHKARTVELNDRAWSVIERQQARTKLRNIDGGLVFINPITDQPWASSDMQRREWEDCLRRVGVRYRPPKELRDTSVTLALAAGADPWWVAKQHGHSIQTMQREYAKFMPDADKGRNRAAMNAALAAPEKAQGVGN